MTKRKVVNVAAYLIDVIAAFAMPVFEALVKGQPFDRHWPPEGPWQ